MRIASFTAAFAFDAFAVGDRTFAMSVAIAAVTACVGADVAVGAGAAADSAVTACTPALVAMGACTVGDAGVTACAVADAEAL
jgi:hypothetical protein